MRLKSIFQKTLLGVAGVMVALALGELILRVWTPKSLTYKAVRRSDPVFHHSLIPSASYMHHDRDFSVEVRTNSLGFRDREHFSDSSNTYKVIVLGDSFVEGYGVPMESCFVRRLEGKLNTRASLSHPVTVYNLGVAAYSPIIEYLVMKHRGVMLNPDLVILCYDITDVQEDILYAEDCEFDSLGRPVRVNPSWPSFGHVTLVPRSEVKTILREKSYLYTYIADAISIVKPQPLYERGNINAGQYMHAVDSTTAYWEKYFDQSQSYVLMTAELCRSRGIPFVLVTFPRGNQVNSLEWREGRKEWGIDTLTYDSAIFPSLRQFAENHQIPFLDMTPTFRARSRGDLYLPHDGHWTSAGHAVAAETLAVFLAKNNLFQH